MRRRKLRESGAEWMLVKRSDRKNVSIKYRADSRSPWLWGSSGVTTKKAAQKVAQKLVHKWLADTERDVDSWVKFRERYESEKLAGGKPRTAEAFRTAANRLETLCPIRFVQELDESHFSKFDAELRRGGASTATRQAYRDHLLMALKWAKTVKIISHKPEPPAIKGEPSNARGRPLTREEAERITLKLPEIVGADCAKRWAWNFEALWRSGFRIGETFAFTWEPSEFHYVYDLDGNRPMIAIAAPHEKGAKVRLLPMAPDFAYLLRAVPPKSRRGQVFRWIGMRGGGVRQKTVEKRIAKAGKDAKVIVGTKTNGDPRFASAHDFRRAFGARWAPKVMPLVLQAMMRHASISTTEKYYVGENSRRNADALWKAFDASDSDFGAKLGDTLDSLFANHEIEQSKKSLKHCKK